MFSIDESDFSALAAGDSISSMPLSSWGSKRDNNPARLFSLVYFRTSCISLRDVCNFLMDSGFRSSTASHILGIDTVLDIRPVGIFSASVANSCISLMT